MIVSDTSPLNYLILIQAVDLLPQLYRTVVAPPEVLQELSHPKAQASVRTWALGAPSWLAIKRPRHVPESVRTLDPGESAAIALALELKDTTLLIDEKAGTKIATSLGLQTVGTLGILLAAHQRKLSNAHQLLERLTTETSFRVSQSLRSEFLISLKG